VQIRADDLEPAFKMLSRVARTQAQMIQSWDVLGTMTPADYTRFRDALGHSSGFQSWQYRHLEFLLGAKDARMIDVHAADPPAHALLSRALAEPSLYDESLRLLARRGFRMPAERLGRDFAEPYEAHAGVEAAWLEVYRNADEHWDLYELAEKLVDLEYRSAVAFRSPEDGRAHHRLQAGHRRVRRRALPRVRAQEDLLPGAHLGADVGLVTCTERGPIAGSQSDGRM
jgi:tryptophan 2,3-dioxygenase